MNRKKVSNNVFLMLAVFLLLFLNACGEKESGIKSPEEIKSELSDLKDNRETPQKEAKKQEESQNGPQIKPETGEQEPVPDTRLVFTGDVMPYDCVLDNYDASGIRGILDEKLQKVLTDGDITMVNQEFPFSTGGSQAEDKQFTFRINPSYVTLLEDLGTDLVTLANNHTLDYGAEALTDTFDTLDSAGILYTGAGATEKRARELQIIEKNGKKFGFLAASRVIPVTEWDVRNSQPGVFTTYDPADLLADIAEAESQCDFLTVYVHWGIERAEYPESYETVMARQYIDAGADLVIGSHPHVLQGFEFYKGKAIVYSLGNFIFNASIPSTVILEATVDADNHAVFRLVPATASHARTVSMTEEEGRKLFGYLEKRSTDVVIGKRGKLSPRP